MELSAERGKVPGEGRLLPVLTDFPPPSHAIYALYRDPVEANARLVWIVVAYALIGFSMTWLFRRMYPERRVRARDGLQFGLAIALVSFLPWHLLAYVGQPLPSGLLARQVVFDLLSMLLLGRLLVWLRPNRAPLSLPE